MTADVAVDNDVLHKLACYDLLAEVRDVLCESGQPGVLGAARYVVGGLLKREDPDTGVHKATGFKDFLDSAEELEPTDDELALAVELEELAQRSGVEVDSGESQLLAIATTRGFRMVATGDKRAIAGVEALRAKVTWLERLEHRIACLEQLMATLVSSLGASDCHGRVCAAKGVDKAISACFGCNGARVDEESIRQGLSSYVEDLRKSAPTMLKLGALA